MKTVFELIETNGLTLHGDIEHLAELVRADEREASIDAVLQIIKELRPALVLTAFADKDNAWVLDKVKESIEKLKEKPNEPRPNKRL